MPPPFGALLACALLAHQLWWGGFATTSREGVLALAALWLLARPGSLRRLLVLAGVAAIVLGLRMPVLGEHLLLAFAACLGLLAWSAAGLRRATPAASWDALAPFLRAAAVLLYGAAALAKLNTGFLDPATSCAVVLSGRLDPVAPPAAVAIAGTIAAEATLAVLLAVRRTRRAGVVCGLVFHAVLALAGNVPFAVLMAAFYVAFVCDARPSAAVAPGRGRAALVFGGLVLAWLAGAALGPVPGAYGGPVGAFLPPVVAAGLLAGGVRVARGRGVAPARRLAPAYGVVLGLLLLVAASPYLGLRTEGVFAMYSNLRTEPGYANSLVVPEALRVFGAQDDLVRVVATDDPRLRRAGAGGLLVRAEAERFLRAHPGSSATLAAPGEPAGGPVSAATLPAAPVADRLLNFGTVRAGC